MFRHLLSSAALLAALSVTATADTIWVDADNPNCPGSGTFADPYCSIQAAVEAATAFDTVSVLPGTYVENVWIQSKVLTLIGREGAGVTTIQGFEQEPTVTVLGAAAGTVIEGFTITGGKGLWIGGNPFHSELAGAGIFASADVTVRNNVIEGNAFDAGGDTWTGFGGGIAIMQGAVGIIQGNVIRSNTCTFGGGIYYSGGDGGQILGNVIEDHPAPSGRGGGMVVDGSAPLVANNVIRNNVSTVGAGMAIGYGAAPLVIDNVITGNHTDEDEGGGVLIADSAPVLRGNIITDNVSVSLGGGIYTQNSASVIVDNLIQDNWASGGGGGVWAQDATIEGNEIAGNFTFGNAGGIETHGATTITRNLIRDNEPAGISIWSGSPLVTDNVIVRNAVGIERAKGTILRNTITESTYDGITVEDDATPLIESCVVWGNGASPASEIFVFSGEPTVKFSDVRGGHAGTGNMGTDPLFVDPSSDDYRLQPGSPCIDVGDPTDLVCGLDVADRPRRLDGLLDGPQVVDMGAHEFGHVDLAAELSPSHLAVQTTGTPGLPVFMVIALEPDLACVSAYGPVLFDLTSPWSLFGWGNNPTLTVLELPPVIPVPSLVMQALVLTDKGHRGNLSKGELVEFP